jgi:hypothetical protein
VLVVDEEAVLDVRNFDIAMRREEFARARGTSMTHRSGPGRLGLGPFVVRARYRSSKRSSPNRLPAAKIPSWFCRADATASRAASRWVPLIGTPV